MNRLEELSKQSKEVHKENMKQINKLLAEATIMLYEMQAIEKRLKENKQHEHYR